jgi:hypothetical protein
VVLLSDCCALQVVDSLVACSLACIQHRDCLVYECTFGAYSSGWIKFSMLTEFSLPLQSFYQRWPVTQPPLSKPAEDKASAAAQKRRRDAAGNAADVDDDEDEQINPEFELPTGLPGFSLADLIPEAKEPGLSEEKHMQPTLMTILEAMGDKAKCQMQIIDTHSATKQFQNPTGRPDCSLLASPIIAWPQAVSFFEFKLWDTIAETFHSFGQQTSRVSNTRNQQPERTHWVTVGLTMNSAELAVFSRGDLDQLTVQRTGPQPFSIHHDSPGFRLVLQVLASPPIALGFQQLCSPSIKTMTTQYRIQKLTQVHRGTAPQGCSSIVYEALITGLGKCILKLNQSSKEVRFF